MKDWVGDGPITFRAAALFGGALMVLTGFFGTLGGCSGVGVAACWVWSRAGSGVYYGHSGVA